MNDIEQAALKNLFDAGMPNPSRWHPPPEEVLMRHQAWVDKQRTWAHALSERATRNAYLKWIDCTQRQIDQCRDENITGLERKRDEANRARRADDDQRVRDLAVTLPKPESSR